MYELHVLAIIIPLVCRKYAVSITCTDADYGYV